MVKLGSNREPLWPYHNPETEERLGFKNTYVYKYSKQWLGSFDAYKAEHYREKAIAKMHRMACWKGAGRRAAFMSQQKALVKPSSTTVGQ